MLYKDPINEQQFLNLAAVRDVCISLFMPTTRMTESADKDRIRLKDLAKAALQEAESIADKRQIKAMEVSIQALHDDEHFWIYQGNGLGIFLTPENIKAYRLSYTVDPVSETGDRFYLKPLVPALRPISAYVLALTPRNAKLYELTPEQTLEELAVPNMPKDFSKATGVSFHTNEEFKGFQLQFLRAVEKAVTAYISSTHIPLILAATAQQQNQYRSINTYEYLDKLNYEADIEKLNEAQLREHVIPLMGQIREERIQNWDSAYQQSLGTHCGIAGDIPTIAKLATNGQIAKLLVDADYIQYGTVSETGDVNFSSTKSATTYDVLDEIVVRVMAHDGDVLVVRKTESAPAHLLPVAAILRWAN